jgi:predicted nucleotidyltransferase
VNHLSLKLPQQELAAFCRRHDIARLSIFGSALRDDFGPASDVDLLIEFQPHAEPSLLDLGGMQQELCDLLGRQVDLKTPEFMSPFVRERVQREALLQYAA